MRQYRVTHCQTGEQTLVNVPDDNGHPYPEAARLAGYRYVLEADVAIVPSGYERKLPFDTLPLVVRRASSAPEVEVAA